MDVKTPANIPSTDHSNQSGGGSNGNESALAVPQAGGDPGNTAKSVKQELDASSAPSQPALPSGSATQSHTSSAFSDGVQQSYTQPMQSMGSYGVSSSSPQMGGQGQNGHSQMQGYNQNQMNPQGSQPQNYQQQQRSPSVPMAPGQSAQPRMPMQHSQQSMQPGMSGVGAGQQMAGVQMGAMAGGQQMGGGLQMGGVQQIGGAQHMGGTQQMGGSRQMGGGQQIQPMATGGGQSADKLSHIQRLAAQLQQVKELQAKLQATLAKKKAAEAKASQNNLTVPIPGGQNPNNTLASPPLVMQGGSGVNQGLTSDAIQRQMQLPQQMQRAPNGMSGGPRGMMPQNPGRMQQSTNQGYMPPSKWVVDQVLGWLDQNGFGSQREVFRRNGVDGSQLLSLSFNDLHSMGVSDEGMVSRILQAVATLRGNNMRAGGDNVNKRSYDTMSRSGMKPRSSSSRPTKPPKRSRKRFAWIATIESWVLEHEMHCSSYHPGEKQTQGPEPNICCSSLRNGAQYTLRVVPNSNKCCGVSDLIVLCNTETKKVIGSLPCSMTQFLAPLMQNDLIVLTGATTCVIHPEGGVPPFELAVEGDLMRLAGLKRDPRFRMHIRKLTCLLDNWEGDWIDSDYPTNIESIKNLLSTD
uniref:SAM domain-containing protein n=1 Tax=Lotharella oceanica TaxID=641309 RepID=A0A7S2TUN7_9EUKA